MTASVWRRLTDLPVAYVEAIAAALGRERVPADATTTETIDADPRDLASAIAAVAAARDDRVYITVLSEAQALAIQQGGLSAERLLRVVQQAAQTTTLRQRVTDYSDRGGLLRGAEGPPATVVVLWRGVVQADVPARSRSRSSLRLTLDDEAIEWVRQVSQRDGVSQSSVVNDLILARAADGD